MERLGRIDSKKRIFAFLLKKPVALITISCFVLFAVIFAGYFLPLRSLSPAHASAMVKLPGQLPPLVKQSKVISAVDGSTPVDIVIGLHLRNADGLTQYVKSVSQPQDKTKRTLSAAQITEAYSPLPSSDQAVIDYMQQAGFQTTKTFNNHLLIEFKGTIAQAEQAFNVQIDNYQSPKGKVFYAPSTDLDIPASIAPFVESISGLDNATQFSHTPIRKPVNANTGSRPNTTSAFNSSVCQTDSGVGGNYYTPLQLATAYNLTNLKQNFQGEGQTIGLFELADYKTSDISAYTASCGVGGSIPITRTRIQPPGGVSYDDGTLEADLDVELLTSTAPKLAGIKVYEAPYSTNQTTDNTNSLLLWGQIVSDATPIVSTSWGACETSLPTNYLQQENDLFTIAAAQGQSIFAASGDAGSDSCQIVPTNTTPNPLNVIDPASQAYVTAVGGTQLTVDGNNSYVSETTWNDANGAGGGGISSVWTKPSWQSAPGVPDTTYSSGSPCSAPGGQDCREVPDVSLLAGGLQGYPIYCSGVAICTSSSNPSNWWVVGGTSAAAPMWAAMTALANQKSLSQGYFNLGFLNPMLYQIASNSTEYANDFHDITTGNNNVGINGQTQYPATTGYDMATGLGSYNAANLVNDLISIAATKTGARSAPANTTWYFAEGAVGGGFTEFLTILNPSPTQTATVNITYLFDNKAAQTVLHTVSAASRSTITVNNDVGVQYNYSLQSLSAIVNSNIPVVAERPMYFNFANSVPSGTDVVGATNATQQNFYFAEGDSRQNSNQSYSTFLTILNPSNNQTAHVTVTYYANGAVVGSTVIPVSPLMRGTTTPASLGIKSQVSIKVTSDIGVVVERPLYFKDVVPTAGGTVTGAASAVGATALGNDWLFAEGYTASGFQEYLVLANFTATDTTANVKLEYNNGQQQNVPVVVKAYSQTYFDVNNANAHPNNCGCTPTTETSAEVTTPTASIVAERLMYFHFAGYPGGTDIVGENGPSSHTNYAFAEGYTASNFSEFLTLQNPTTQPVDVVLTLFANGNGTVIEKTYQLKPQSRFTVPINDLVVPIAQAYSGNYEVSIDVQALNGTVVVERPLYFNYVHSTGASDVLGYTGG